MYMLYVTKCVHIYIAEYIHSEKPLLAVGSQDVECVYVDYMKFSMQNLLHSLKSKPT